MSPFNAAFDRWIARRTGLRPLRQDSSLAVYRSMWEAFAKWCLANGHQLEQLQPQDLDAFIHARAQVTGQVMTDRHAWRWLSLLDGVLHAGTRDRALGANRAAAALLESRPAWRYANASARDPLPSFLDAGQARQLVVWLLDAHNGYRGVGAPPGSWQDWRNRASVALQLGAGLTPGDLRALNTEHVVSRPRHGRTIPQRLRVPAHGVVDARSTPIAPWAARLLARWLAERAQAGLPGAVLFPGTRRGQAWSKVSQYTSAAGVLEAAGLGGLQGGSFILRHTFALRYLQRGRAPGELSRWLGVSDPGVMERYLQVAADAVVAD